MTRRPWTLLLPALIAGTPATAAPEKADIQPAVAAYREGRLMDALEQMSDALWEDPGNGAARNYVWAVAREMKAKEGRLPTPAEVAAGVHLAQEELTQKRAAAQAVLEDLRDAYHRSRNPQGPAELLSNIDGVEKYLAADDLSERTGPQARAYFDGIFRELQTALAKGAFVLPAEKLKAQGFLAYYLGKWEEASALWEKALKSAPKDMKLRANLENVKRIAERRRGQEKARDLARQAELFQGVGDWAQAVSVWNEVLQADPDHPEARARLQESMEKNVRARKNEELTRKMKEGVALYRAEKYVEAAQAWLGALQVDPNNAQARAWLARTGEKMNTLKSWEAPAVTPTSSTGKALPATPRDEERAQGLYRDGVMLYSQDKIAEALSVWKQAVRYNPASKVLREAIRHAEAELSLLNPK